MLGVRWTYLCMAAAAAAHLQVLALHQRLACLDWAISAGTVRLQWLGYGRFRSLRAWDSRQKSLLRRVGLVVVGELIDGRLPLSSMSLLHR